MLFNTIGSSQIFRYAISQPFNRAAFATPISPRSLNFLKPFFLSFCNITFHINADLCLKRASININTTR